MTQHWLQCNVIMLLCHIILSLCHYAIMSLFHHVIMSYCHLVIMSYCHHVIMSNCHHVINYVIMSSCHHWCKNVNWIMWKSIDKMKITLNVKKYWQKINYLNFHCMTVPVKEGYKQVVYHCDVKTKKEKKKI